jgi:putative nucleotidyltransferase with HDIG domain
MLIAKTLDERADRHRIAPAVADLLTGEQWEHAQLVAICGQLLAQKLGYFNVCHAFAAGLFHDVGKIALSLFPPEEVASLLAIPRADGHAELTHGDRALGFDHSLIGSRLLDRWGLPPAVVEPVTLHHAPCHAKLNRRLALILHVADALMYCHVRGLPLGISLFPVQSRALAEFPLDREALNRVAKLTCTLASGELELLLAESEEYAAAERRVARRNSA